MRIPTRRPASSPSSPRSRRAPSKPVAEERPPKPSDPYVLLSQPSCAALRDAPSRFSFVALTGPDPYQGLRASARKVPNREAGQWERKINGLGTFGEGRPEARVREAETCSGWPARTSPAGRRASSSAGDRQISQGGSTSIRSSSTVGPSAANAPARALGNSSIDASRSPRAPNARASAGKSGLARSVSPQRPANMRSWSHLMAPYRSSFITRNPIGSRYFTAVASSLTENRKPPSPQTESTARPGLAICAPIAAGTAYPSTAEPTG